MMFIENIDNTRLESSEEMKCAETAKFCGASPVRYDAMQVNE